MECETGRDKLSPLYDQIDKLTPDEKSKLMQYLAKSLTVDEHKTATTTEQTKSDLVGAIESNEYREKITPADVSIYIHGNPQGHQSFGDVANRQNDPLLAKGHFDKYYTGLIKNQKLFLNNLGNGSTEYTIVEPSREVAGRSGGYVGLTIVLKNGYTVKKESIAELMHAFQKYFLEDCGVLAKSRNTLEWKTNNKDVIRKVVFQLKNVLISSMNDNPANKGIIEKNK